MAYTFLTGATGLLGRYLIKDLTLSDVPVAVLVRPSRRATALHRVENVMCYWDKQLGCKLPRPVVMEGDITEPDLGLDARGMRWVAENCDAMLHNAASLSFQSTGPASEPWRSNVEGLRNVLELCRNARIRQFHHVSTAYVCGQRQGRILESDLDVGQTLSNDYEQSKIQAEKIVRSASFLDSLTVFRPAIIVGDSQNSFTTTYHGFYAPLQAAYTMVRAMEVNSTGRVSTQTRFPLSTFETKNLVPVDWVSAVMVHVMTHPQHHGATYHLTPQHPVTARMLADVLEESCGFYGVRLVGGGTQLTGLTEIEQLFCELIKVYSSYWKDDPTFDATATRTAAPHLPCPHVDRRMLRRMADWAIGVNFTSPRAKPVEPHFDVAGALEQFLDSAGPAANHNIAPFRLGLRVTGHGGGDWSLSLSGDEIVAADLGLHPQRVATLQCDVDLLADLASGRTTIDEALLQHVRISGESVPQPVLTRALSCLVEAAVAAPSASAAAAG
ncbi:MAG: NAD-dependent epimerase/dehydratase family protein [Planctomycetaceae bacterium]|nr:NAD-dependent epimerase/dehydratase family protein [Planctomycetaceae bacterium]